LSFINPTEAYLCALFPLADSDFHPMSALFQIS
jgi:hypothetical protein